MFDAMEAVDELIDDINNDYYESCYDAIYEELCERVECGELTIKEAEMINESAAEKYLTESTKSLERKADRIYKKGMNHSKRYIKKINKEIEKRNFKEAARLSREWTKVFRDDVLDELSTLVKLSEESNDEDAKKYISNLNEKAKKEWNTMVKETQII